MDATLSHNMLPGSLELAYLGDTLYDLRVRETLIRTGSKVNALHSAAIALVNAHAQSEALERIHPMLSEEELSVVRRARNAHQSAPRNAAASDYHRATGLEALIGYLYIMNRKERLEELLDAALPQELILGGMHHAER